MIDPPILYGQGAQTIRWVPVDELGHPRALSSATYAIVDLREGESTSSRSVVASTAATAPTVSTTTTAAAGPSTANPRAVALTSATGVRVGGVYLLRDTTGAVEESCTVLRLVSAAVELTRPLTRAFATGAAFVGLELSGTFPADVANDEARLDGGGGPFQVTWSYTIGSVLYVAPRELWITRYGVAPWVRPDQVFRFFPGLAGYVGQQIDPHEAIAAATDEYAELLQASGRDPAYTRGHPSATLYVCKRAIVHLCRGSRAADLQAAKDDFVAEATMHAGNLLGGRTPVRTAVVSPDTDTDTPGGTKSAPGDLFARG
jgi:hypothetical protein